MIYKLLGIRKVEPEVNIGDYVHWRLLNSIRK